MVNIESIFVVKGEYNNSQTFQVSQSQKKEMSIDITTRITKKYNTIQIQCTIKPIFYQNSSIRLDRAQALTLFTSSLKKWLTFD